NQSRYFAANAAVNNWLRSPHSATNRTTNVVTAARRALARGGTSAISSSTSAASSTGLSLASSTATAPAANSNAATACTGRLGSRRGREHGLHRTAERGRSTRHVVELRRHVEDLAVEPRELHPHRLTFHLDLQELTIEGVLAHCRRAYADR